MATIESQDLSIGKLFNDFYVIPSYQREYVWEKEHVREFIEDIYTEFSASNSTGDSEYFIGSIIVCNRQDGLYEVIDGQQRITTSYLFLCAIRDYLLQIKPEESIELLKNQIASTDIDEEGNNVFRYRVALQYDDSYGVLETIAKQEELNIKTATTRSTQNIKNAYSVISDWLVKELNDSSVQSIKRFYAYFNKNVILVRVKTASVADALRVFATINGRGVNLGAIDLLKNLIFMNTNKKDYDRLKKKWQEMVDILFKTKESHMRFLRYFILARYDDRESLKENGIYNWFLNTNNKRYYENRPIEFVDEILESAKNYVKFLEGKDVEGKRNRYLENIRQISGSVRMPLMVILAGQHLATDQFTELCRQVENIFFAYMITREPTSSFERRFIQWCSELRQVTNQEKLDKFITTYLKVEKHKISERFEIAFSNLEESSIPKSQLKYILAKFTQYIDESAWGTSEPISNLKNYIDKIDIEHILPQTPTLQIVSSFDVPKDIDIYTKRLGNLTLVEKPINSSLSNKSFDEKKKAYKQSKLLLTKSLVEQVAVGKNTAVDRAVQDLESFDVWTSESIKKRQKMLTLLAKKVWDISV